MRKIVIAGSTGSIGTQALDVIERSQELELSGLSAATSWEPLLEQADRFGVKRIALSDPDAAARASERWTDGEVLAGPLTDVEGLLVADLDLDDITRGRYDFDAAGHYSRPDLFTLVVDRREQNHVAATSADTRPTSTAD